MKLNVGKVVDKMTRGVVSPLTRWRMVMTIPSLTIILGLGHMLSQIKPIQHTWLVKVMQCRVSDIWVKRGQGEIWIHTIMEKNYGDDPFHTKGSIKTNKINKQKRKKNLAYVRVDLRPNRLLTGWLSRRGISQ